MPFTSMSSMWIPFVQGLLAVYITQIIKISAHLVNHHGIKNKWSY